MKLDKQEMLKNLIDSGGNPEEIDGILDELFAMMKDYLNNGVTVDLPKIGKLRVVTAKARTRNVFGKMKEIPSRSNVKFEMHRSFRDKIRVKKEDTLEELFTPDLSENIDDD